jgi:hypothetical protein
MTTAITATCPDATKARNGRLMTSSAAASRGATGMRDATRVKRSWKRTTSAGLMTTSSPQADADSP